MQPFLADGIVWHLAARARSLATLRAQRVGKHLQDNVVHVMHGDGTGKATEVWASGSDPAAPMQA